MGEQDYLILDYETRSEIDLKKAGAYEYSRHPTTELLCVAWRRGTRETLKTAPIHSYSPFLDTEGDESHDYFSELLARFQYDRGDIFIAHNAFFEQSITTGLLMGEKFFNPARWICTASMAAALALPRNLEDACIALNLPVKKDMEGRRLMLKYTKPRRASKHNDEKWHSDREEIERIVQYCKQDVAAETELFLALPPLHPREHEVWKLDQKINFRGIKVDRPLVEKTLDLIKEETEYLENETVEVSEGRLTSTRKVAALKNYCNRHGVPIENVQAKTIADTLARPNLPARPRRLLEIRQNISRTSTAKYEAFERRSRTDGYVRDILMYHGASTGRWSGTGVQVQNFPRGQIKDTWEAVEIVKNGDLELIRMLYGNPMEVFSSCLRSALVARDGMQFYRGDYSSIEVRVLFWLAHHKAGMRAYDEKRDLYREMAQIIYNVKDLDDVTKDQREIGKRAILGCGYGMGATKFRATCIQFGQDVSEELSEKAVRAYRETHPVPQLWSNLEQCVIRAIKSPGYQFKIHHTVWWVENKFLWCKLPSGRKLAYYKPSVKLIPTRWKTKKDTIHHWGVNSLTKKWEEQTTWGGTLTENIDQAIARDLLVEAMLRLEDAGYETCMTVHDEILSEHRNGSVEEFSQLMGIVPGWGTGIPIALDAASGPRYKKW